MATHEQKFRRQNAVFGVSRTCCLIAALFSPVSVALAQNDVRLELSSTSIAAGTADLCRYVVRRSAGRDADKAAPDSVSLRIVDRNGGAVASPAPLLLVIAGSKAQSVPLGTQTIDFKLEPGALVNRQVRLFRATEVEAKPLCSINAIPAEFAATDLGVTRHDIFAGGEVGAALGTGATAGPASGSLGLHSMLYRGEARPFRFPFGGLPRVKLLSSVFNALSYRVDLEEVRAEVSVAGSGDSLFTPGNGALFAQAVLAPQTALRGRLGGVNVMYSPQQRYGTNSLRGLRFSGGATRSRWGGVLDSSNSALGTPDTVFKNVVIFSGDVRVRFVFINHTKDDDGNTFSFAMDGGWAYRAVSGDLASRGAEAEALRTATIGTPDRIFRGPIGGLYITLRQVQAFAKLQNLSVGRKGGRAKVEGLEGWQPLIGFRFEAPIFTIGGK